MTYIWIHIRTQQTKWCSASIATCNRCRRAVSHQLAHHIDKQRPIGCHQHCFWFWFWFKGEFWIRISNLKSIIVIINQTKKTRKKWREWFSPWVSSCVGAHLRSTTDVKGVFSDYHKCFPTQLVLCDISWSRNTYNRYLSMIICYFCNLHVTGSLVNPFFEFL